MKTIKEHETSYQALSAKFEAGADAVEALSQSRSLTNEKITRKPRPITQRDLNEIPGLRDHLEGAQLWKEIQKSSTGRRALIASKAFREDKALCYELRDQH